VSIERLTGLVRKAEVDARGGPVAAVEELTGLAREAEMDGVDEAARDELGSSIARVGGPTGIVTAQDDDLEPGVSTPVLGNANV
jgi:hypothetical protein